MLLAGLVPASIAFARATAADGTVDRLQVPAGGTVTVKVSGFVVDKLLSSWASSVRGTVYSTAEVDTDVTGSATLQIQTGRFWEPGWWAVTVNGQYSDIRTIVRFEITAAIPDGRLDIEPDTASPGSTIAFTVPASPTASRSVSGPPARMAGSTRSHPICTAQMEKSRLHTSYLKRRAGRLVDDGVRPRFGPAADRSVFSYRAVEPGRKRCSDLQR